MKKSDYVAYYVTITFAVIRLLMVIGGVELGKFEQIIWIVTNALLLFCVKKDWEDKSKLM